MLLNVYVHIHTKPLLLMYLPVKPINLLYPYPYMALHCVHTKYDVICIKSMFYLGKFLVLCCFDITFHHLFLNSLVFVNFFNILIFFFEIINIIIILIFFEFITFFAEICIKTMLFYMFITWHSACSTQFMWTNIHIKYLNIIDILTYFDKIQQINNNNMSFNKEN